MLHKFINCFTKYQEIFDILQFGQILVIDLFLKQMQYLQDDTFNSARYKKNLL